MSKKWVRVYGTDFMRNSVVFIVVNSINYDFMN